MSEKEKPLQLAVDPNTSAEIFSARHRTVNTASAGILCQESQTVARL